MILIKDRHLLSDAFMKYWHVGKYDTYKGSTPFFLPFFTGQQNKGKYDTYKGSTRTSSLGQYQTVV